MPKKKQNRPSKRRRKHGPDYTLADQIEEARAAAELSRKQLADACGVDRMTVARWEWNQNAPTADNLAAIADACGCDYEPAVLLPAKLIPAAPRGTPAPGKAQRG